MTIEEPRDPSTVVSPPSRLEQGKASDSDEEGRVFEDERGGGALQSTSNLGEQQQDGAEGKYMGLSSMDESQVRHAKRAAFSRGRLRRRARFFQGRSLLRLRTATST